MHTIPILCLALATSAASSAGCLSVVGQTGPNEKCRTSRTLPVIDTVLAAALLGVSAVVHAKSDDKALEVGSLVLVAGEATSAAYGYVGSWLCRTWMVED